MIEYILLTGFGAGAIFSFIVWYCCKDENPINPDSDSPRSENSYVHFLEDILNNTTNMTKESYALHEVDVSCTNITEANVIVVSPVENMADDVQNYISTSLEVD